MYVWMPHLGLQGTSNAHSSKMIVIVTLNLHKAGWELEHWTQDCLFAIARNTRSLKTSMIGR